MLHKATADSARVTVGWPVPSLEDLLTQHTVHGLNTHEQTYECRGCPARLLSSTQRPKKPWGHHMRRLC